MRGINSAEAWVARCSDDDGVKVTKQVLDELGMSGVSHADLQQVRRICRVLSHRAACLVAAGI